MSKIAVLIPVYNAPTKLAATLHSLDIQQGRFDIFVVDDGSTPKIDVNHSEFCHSIRLINLPENRGIEFALNAGLKDIFAGDYDYVARQDAGDLDVNNRLAVQSAYLDSHPKMALVGAWVRNVQASGEPLFEFRPRVGIKEIRRRMCYGSAFAHPASMMRISALQDVGPYSDKYPCAEDYDLFFRIINKYQAGNIPQILVVKEHVPHSLSFRRRNISLISRLRIQIKNFSFASWHSYFGLIQSMMLLIIPYEFVIEVKKIRTYSR